MKCKEDALNIFALKKRGLSNRRIAQKLGIDPRTVKKYASAPEKAFLPRVSRHRESKLDPFFGNIEAWLNEDPFYSAAWVFDRLKPMGYAGCYEMVKRKVRSLKSERTRVAYLRFETEPGLQAQVDWGEFFWDRPDGTSSRFYLFAMILGYSRKLYCELVDKCDLTTFLDCHIRAFEFFGGVPAEILYDRMRNVFLRKFLGKDIFNRSLMSLAVHYAFKPMVAPAYAPWVKGKVERPMNFVREGFWRGYRFMGLDRANRDLFSWLEIKSQRVHGTTHERVDERFNREKPTLGTLPGTRFDTSYRIFRDVHKDCCVHFDANRYMVPHTLVAKKLVLRVKDRVLRVFHDDDLIVVYEIPAGKGHLVKQDRFVDALRQDREMNRRKYGRSGKSKGRAGTISPTLPPWSVDVEKRSLDVYNLIEGHSASLPEEVTA